MKSVDCGRELEEAAHCIKLLGARLEECRDYTIPGTDVIHRLVVLRKVAPTLKGYPRRWAKIQKARCETGAMSPPAPQDRYPQCTEG